MSLLLLLALVYPVGLKPSGGIRTAAPHSPEPNVLLNAFVGTLARPSQRGCRVGHFHVISHER
jgi:hypothetical protein